jgi:hypothetical protein
VGLLGWFLLQEPRGFQDLKYGGLLLISLKPTKSSLENFGINDPVPEALEKMETVASTMA